MATYEEAIAWIDTHPKVQVTHVIPGHHSNKMYKPKTLGPNKTPIVPAAMWYMSVHLDCSVGKILLRSEAHTFLEAYDLLRAKLNRHYEDLKQYL